MAYSTQRQTGSVITYLIIGVLLVAAAIGAIVVVQNRSSSDLTTRPEPTEVAQQQPEEERSVEAPEDERDATDEARDTENSADQESAPEQSEQPAQEEGNSAPVAPQADAAMPTGGGVTTQSALPNTGPVQTTLGNVIGLLAIIGAGYGYYHFGQRR